jgi:transcriptional regulator with XRE-family HTH domain
MKKPEVNYNKIRKEIFEYRLGLDYGLHKYHGLRYLAKHMLISSSTISRILIKKAPNISLETFLQICNFFQVDVKYFLK